MGDYSYCTFENGHLRTRGLHHHGFLSVAVDNQTVGIQNKQFKTTNFHICVLYERNNLMYLDILVLPEIYATFPYLNQ
jgi:hypothetical protein